MYLGAVCLSIGRVIETLSVHILNSTIACLSPRSQEAIDILGAHFRSAFPEQPTYLVIDLNPISRALSAHWPLVVTTKSHILIPHLLKTSFPVLLHASNWKGFFPPQDFLWILALWTGIISSPQNHNACSIHKLQPASYQVTYIHYACVCMHYTSPLCLCTVWYHPLLYPSQHVHTHTIMIHTQTRVHAYTNQASTKTPVPLVDTER